MSCQPPPRNRWATSPRQQLRPVKATLPVALMRQHQSPTKNTSQTNESPPDLLQRSGESDDGHPSKDELPMVFLGPRGEKSKTLNMRSQPQQHHIRRTSSLDALFLASQWKPETIFLGCFMVDRATQTPDEWNETEVKTTQRKSIVTGGEHLEVKYIRQKLQRTNQNRGPCTLFGSQRQSPIQGDHSAISILGGNHPSAFGPVQKAAHSGICHSHSKKAITSPRLQSSLEGLNQEIEKIVLRDSYGLEKGNSNRLFEPTPEGHRAPIAELFHSIKDQPESSGTGNRSHSISPSIPIIPGVPEYSNSPPNDDTDGLSKLGSSPHINEFLTREPPDGCEKVKISDEPQRRLLFDLPSGVNLTKPQQVYVLLPSQSSAFCPLHKDMNPPTTLAYTVLPSTQICQK